MKFRQLLCTFSKDVSYKDDVRKIGKLYPNVTIKYFVFENKKSKNDAYITYNVEASKTFQKFPSTISIHRKKETNTLYTLNAMNKLIAEENGGKYDKSFNLNWDLYRNCLILTNDVGVRIIDIKLLEII